MSRETRNNKTQRGTRGNLAFLWMVALLATACGSTNDAGRNHPPVITALIASSTTVTISQQVTLSAIISDQDGDSLSALWEATAGGFLQTSDVAATWEAPDTAAAVVVTLTVEDGQGGRVAESVTINVANQPPVIQTLTASPQEVFVSNIVRLNVTAQDPDGGTLTYVWSSGGQGQFLQTTADSAVWIATSSTGVVAIQVKVMDPLGAADSLSITITVSGEVGSVWIADTFNDRVVKMSGTGNVLPTAGGFARPQAIAVNARDQQVWVVDFGNNLVKKLDNNGNILVTIDSLFEPRAVAVYEFDGSAWITQSSASRQVLHVRTDGVIIGEYDGFNSPRAVAVDQRDGRPWIADTGNDRIIKLRSNIPDRYDISLNNSFHDAVTGFNEPSALVVNSENGECWIVDRLNNRIMRLNANLVNPFVITGLSKPEGVAVNGITGVVWVADTGNNQVLKFRPDLFATLTDYDINADAGFHEVAIGFTFPILEPFAISVNEQTGNVWFSEQNRVIKISAGDPPLKIIEVSGFQTPRSLVVNSGL